MVEFFSGILERDAPGPSNIATIQSCTGTIKWQTTIMNKAHTLTPAPICQTESLIWSNHALRMFVRTGLGTLYLAQRIEKTFAGSPAATQVMAAQPAQTHHTSSVLNHKSVFILICDVTVIRNVNMGKMRIWMSAESCIQRIMLFQNMLPTDVKASCTQSWKPMHQPVTAFLNVLMQKMRVFVLIIQLCTSFCQQQWVSLQRYT